MVLGTVQHLAISTNHVTIDKHQCQHDSRINKSQEDWHQYFNTHDYYHSNDFGQHEYNHIHNFGHPLVNIDKHQYNYTNFVYFYIQKRLSDFPDDQHECHQFNNCGKQQYEHNDIDDLGHSLGIRFHKRYF
ncbi:hypothetical protein HDU98_010611 [Podochytrium sp. JEL0797]|nr:hypothetical protein HDU98_010611 [Podochytrium sp. JEL0797]